MHPEQVENAGTSYDKAFADWIVQDFFPTLQVFQNNRTYARNAASLIVVCNFMLQATQPFGASISEHRTMCDQIFVCWSTS